jgi:hypothetical protein
MAMPIVSGYNDVPPHGHLRLPTTNSAVCRCGAVYDRGNIVVPPEFSDLCGRCAFERGLRLGNSPRLPGHHAS